MPLPRLVTKCTPDAVLRLGHFCYLLVRRGRYAPVIFSHARDPATKHAFIGAAGKRYGLLTLVETGTYKGDTLFANKDVFRTIYSIEIDKALHAAAKRRFANDGHVHLLQGDSAHVLPRIVKGLVAPALFWLDGHYDYNAASAKSDKDTPIVAELACVLGHQVKDHVILIDDARYFIGEHDYPTMRGLKRFVQEKDPELCVYVRKDIIVIHKKGLEKIPK